MKRSPFIGLRIITFACLFSNILIFGCSINSKPVEVKRVSVSGVTIAPSSLKEVDDLYETSGTVRAKTVSSVASRVMGTVTSLKVKEGDSVRAGQMLLSIDDNDMLQKVKAATEGNNEAKKALEAAGENKKLTDITYQRYSNLHDEKAISGQELDQIVTKKKIADLDYERAQATFRRSEAGLEEAKVFHAYSRITSPVNGSVVERKIELGSMAVPGVPLFTIEDGSSYRVEINVDEKLSGKIKSGMAATIMIDSIGKRLNGTVTEVVPAIDPQSRSFLVKLAVKGEGLRNGMYGKVAVPVGKKSVVLLPVRAVIEKGQLNGVFTVDKDSIIKYRLVRTGRRYGDEVEIISGLAPDENVITAGLEKAVDGGIVTNAK